MTVSSLNYLVIKAWIDIGNSFLATLNEGQCTSEVRRGKEIFDFVQKVFTHFFVEDNCCIRKIVV